MSKKYYVIYTLSEFLIPKIYKTKATVNKHLQENTKLDFRKFNSEADAQAFTKQVEKQLNRRFLSHSESHINEKFESLKSIYRYDSSKLKTSPKIDTLSASTAQHTKNDESIQLRTTKISIQAKQKDNEVKQLEDIQQESEEEISEGKNHQLNIATNKVQNRAVESEQKAGNTQQLQQKLREEVSTIELDEKIITRQLKKDNFRQQPQQDRQLPPVLQEKIDLSTQPVTFGEKEEYLKQEQQGLKNQEQLREKQPQKVQSSKQTIPKQISFDVLQNQNVSKADTETNLASQPQQAQQIEQKQPIAFQQTNKQPQQAKPNQQQSIQTTVETESIQSIQIISPIETISSTQAKKNESIAVVIQQQTIQQIVSTHPQQSKPTMELPQTAKEKFQPDFLSQADSPKSNKTDEAYEQATSRAEKTPMQEVQLKTSETSLKEEDQLVESLNKTKIQAQQKTKDKQIDKTETKTIDGSELTNNYQEYFRQNNFFNLPDLHIQSKLYQLSSLNSTKRTENGQLTIEVVQRQNPGFSLAYCTIETPQNTIRKIELLGVKNQSHSHVLSLKKGLQFARQCHIQDLSIQTDFDHKSSRQYLSSIDKSLRQIAQPLLALEESFSRVEYL